MFPVGIHGWIWNSEVQGQGTSVAFVIGILAGTFGTLVFIESELLFPTHYLWVSPLVCIITAHHSSSWQSSWRNASHRRSPNLDLASGVLLQLFPFLTPSHSGGAIRGDVILRKASQEWLPCPTLAKDPWASCQLHFLLMGLEQAQGCSSANPLGGHLDDPTTLLSRKRQCQAKVRRESQGCVASPRVAGSNTGDVEEFAGHHKCTPLPTGGGASLTVGWRGAKKSSLNSASSCFSR